VLALAVLLLTAACTDTPGQQAGPSTPASGPAASTTTEPGPEDPLSPRPAIESPAPLGGPTCASADLTLDDADAVVDREWVEVFLLRTSGGPCQLLGRPDVTLLDESGRELAIPVVAGAARPSPVSLNKATSVTFTLTTARTGRCLTAASVVVVLPGDATPLRTATSLTVCDQVTVGPIERRQDDEDEGANG
jgi:hypothetical protein